MAEKDAKGKKQDPRVEQLRPDPSQPPPRARTLEGLWGDSDRDGFARLYLTRDLTVYAEFLVADVILTAEIPADQAPFVGDQATRVELPRDANVDITRSKQAGEIDEFDLDVRFGAARRFASVGFASSGPDECLKGEEDTQWPCGHTCDAFLCETFIGPGGGRCPDGAPGGGTDTCVTCETCDTCDTNCGTCQTDPGAYCTCHTCLRWGCERSRRR